MTDVVAAEEADVTTTTMIVEMVDAETMKTVKSICRSRSRSPQKPVIAAKQDVEEKEVRMSNGSRRTTKTKGSALRLSFSLRLICKIAEAKRVTMLVVAQYIGSKSGIRLN